MSAKIIGEPIAENAKLWRYFGLPKLISLLHTQSLHFARVDTFDDPFEGYPTRKDYALARQRGIHLVLNIETNIVREHAYANCWSQFDVENAGMWSTYGIPSGGVLIQTTLDTFVSAFPSCVSIGKIRYVSSNENALPNAEEEMPDRVLRKLRHYESEKEVRAIVLDDSELGKKTDKGKPVKIDLQKLAEAIIIQPTSPKWIRDAIEYVLKQSGFSSKIRPSNFELLND